MERSLDLIAWLRDGVPLTLLVDLFATDRPPSREIYRTEHADLGWTVGRVA